MAAKKLKLTKKQVDEMAFPEKGQEFHWDSELPGFGLRVTPGAKTYIVQKRVEGKTVRVSLGSSKELTADQARKEAIKQLAQMTTGANPNQIKAEKRARAITLGEVFDEYLEKRTLRPKTVAVYRSAMERFFSGKGEFSDWLSKPVTSITKDMVVKRHKDISAMKGERSNDTGAQAQANQAMRVLRSVLNFAAGEYEDTAGRSILPDNPVKKLSQAKAWNRNVRRQRVIHRHQLKAWMDAVENLTTGRHGKPDTTMRDYMLLCLFSGLRRTNVAALKWANIDLDAGYLKIEADEAKNHEEHRLPLSSFVRELLSKRYEQAKGTGDIYVFPADSETGHLVEPQKAAAKVQAATGIEFTIHDLRRTLITIADGLDIPHYALKRLASHKMTGDVTSGYIAADVERLRKPMQAITDFILKEADRLPMNIEQSTEVEKMVKV